MKSTDLKNYIPLDVDSLFHNMEVYDDIYNQNLKVVLARKGDIISQHKIDRLKKFTSGEGQIMVSASTYNYIQQNNPEILRKAMYTTLEEKSGYTDIKNGVEAMLDSIATDGMVDHLQVKELNNQLTQKIMAGESEDILKCVNAPRPIDEYLEKHIVNVSILNGMIGKWIGLGEAEVAKLITAGLVHDVGKTKIDEEILNAPRKLTDQEMEEAKKHPEHSYEMLSQNEMFSDDIKLAARHHHEKTDGSGYPDGLKGEEISLFARITAVSDIYDAMVSKRCYKDSVNPLDILSDFASGRFTGIDNTITNLFVIKMPALFIGQKVRMNDGKVGVVEFIMPNDINNPIVSVDGVFRQTDEYWRCSEFLYNAHMEGIAGN